MHRASRPLLLILIVLAGGCATVGENYGGIPNFSTVDPEPNAIYRGGQPSRAGIATLKDMGVKTIIDLRDDAVRWERREAADAGIRYINIPSNAARTRPAPIAAFLSAVESAEKPVYVHCRRGRDRTGLEVACYRLVHQSDAWTRQAVIDELRMHGYQRFLFPGIERYLATMDPKDFLPAASADAKAVSAGG